MTVAQTPSRSATGAPSGAPVAHTGVPSSPGAAHAGGIHVDLNGVNAFFGAVSAVAAAIAVLATRASSSDAHRAAEMARAERYFQRDVSEPIATAVKRFVTDVMRELETGATDLEQFAQGGPSHDAVVARTGALAARFDDIFYDLKDDVAFATATWDDAVLHSDIESRLDKIQDDFHERIMQMSLPGRCAPPPGDLVRARAAELLRIVRSYDLARHKIAPTPVIPRFVGPRSWIARKLRLKRSGPAASDSHSDPPRAVAEPAPMEQRPESR